MSRSLIGKYKRTHYLKERFLFVVRQPSRLVRICTLSNAAPRVPGGVDLLEAEELKHVIDFYTHHDEMQ